MSRVTDAQLQTHSNSSSSAWETFCRDEARQWASAFLDRVRSFKLRNTIASGVHDSTFTNEFSAAFLEESSLLLHSTANGMLSNGESRGISTSLPTAHAESVEPSPPPEVTSPRKSNKKSWFSHLFKWSRSQRNRSRPSGASISRQNRTRRNTNVFKDELVRMLNLNADESTSAWQPCRLALLEDNGNPQLEIYCPAKVSCFLIYAIVFCVHGVLLGSLINEPCVSLLIPFMWEGGTVLMQCTMVNFPLGVCY